MFGRKFFGFKNRLWDNCNATLIVGRRRTGKSTLLSYIAQSAIKKGYTVYSNYPIDGTLKMPKKKQKDGRITLDKEFLYENPATFHSFILIDEGETVWNNRSYGQWTDDDSDFFNFLGKNDIHLFICVQNYDKVDINVKRAIDATWFVHKQTIFPNTSVVECDYHDVVKVEDLNTRVLDKKYRKVTYEFCEIPNGTYYFRRKKWYKYFLTLYKDERQSKHFDTPSWHDLVFSNS